MANKVTTTMYHKKATMPIEVMPNQVKASELNGWTQEKPQEVELSPAHPTATTSKKKAVPKTK